MKRCILQLSILLVLLAAFACAQVVRAQISAQEHASHHPGQAPPEGAQPSGAMSGMMEGMMDMMGAPPPKEMYPRLMDLPDLPIEQRAEIERQAHQRMMNGTKLLSEGLNDLSAAAATDDFATMQVATAKMREGMSQFESGLAAHRAIREGKAPRDVASQWFKREMNLLPPASSESGFRLWGMNLFHTAIMAVLVIFAFTMIWMYLFRMRRAALLLQELTGGAATTSITGGAPFATPGRAAPVVTEPLPAEVVPSAGRKWSGTLRVSRIFQETPDVKTFRLMNAVGGALPFRYLPGQYLTVTVPANGKPVKRSYTIASSPTQQD